MIARDILFHKRTRWVATHLFLVLFSVAAFTQTTFFRTTPSLQFKAGAQCADNACYCGKVCLTADDWNAGWSQINAVENGGNGVGYSGVTENTPKNQITPPNALDTKLVQLYYQGTAGQVSGNNNAVNATPSEQFINAVKTGLSQGNLLENFQKVTGGYQPQQITAAKFDLLKKLALTPKDYESGAAVDKLIQSGMFTAGELGVLGSEGTGVGSGEADSTLDVLKQNPNSLFRVCLLPGETNCIGARVAGGCRYIASCSCGGSGQGDTFSCVNSTTSNTVASLCSQNVCKPVGSMVPGSDGTMREKICQSGQVSSCGANGKGSVCNDFGTYETSGTNAHNCGYVGVKLDTDEIATLKDLQLKTIAGCKTAECTALYAKYGGLDNVKKYIAAIGLPLNLLTNNANVVGNNDYLLGENLQYIPNPSGNGVYTRFAGCGDRYGKPSSHNCYDVIDSNGNEKPPVCYNEPGLSCGAGMGSPVVVPVTPQTVTTSSPPPTDNPPEPPDNPKATCGEACGSVADGASCSGNNMACVNNVCRSTLCAVTEQDNQCVCKPVVGPICVDIYASKTAPKLNDQITFTCANVTNAVRYEFRTSYVKAKDSDVGATTTALDSATVSSNVSVPFTVDKVGRYIAQCRPCFANDLCSAWEPLTGQMGAPQLPPVAGPTPTPTATQSGQINNATNSATTANASLIGFVDTVSCENRKATGWAADLQKKNQHIELEMFINGNKVDRFTAAEYRSDVVPETNDNGQHGFTFTMPLHSVMPGNHTVEIKFAGTNKHLTYSPKSYTCPPAATPTPSPTPNTATGSATTP